MFENIYLYKFNWGIEGFYVRVSRQYRLNVITQWRGTS